MIKKPKQTNQATKITQKKQLTQQFTTPTAK